MKHRSTFAFVIFTRLRPPLRALQGYVQSAALALLIAGSANAAEADTSEADKRFMAIREAALAGNKARFAQLADAWMAPATNATTPVATDPLTPYIEYWRIKLDIEQVPDGKVYTFIRNNNGTVLADRLRADWLRQVGKRRDWAIFLQEAPLLADTDADLRCHWLSARAQTNSPGALDDTLQLWNSDTELPSSCQPAFDQLMASDKVDPNTRQLRARRLIEAKKLSGARAVWATLPANLTPDESQIDAVMNSPLRVLNKLPINFGALPRKRETALLALARLARTDAAQAVSEFENLSGRFSTEDREHLFGQFGWMGALQQHPKAAQWCASAGDTPMLPEQQEWCIRAALRAGNWKQVQTRIEQLPSDVRDRPEWVYWLARALTARHHAQQATPLYQRIAGQYHFYGQLAQEALGGLSQVPPKPRTTGSDELAQAKQDAGLRRAIRLLKMDARPEGLREWNWALREKPDRALLAAAELARSEGLIDRAISAADRTRVELDFSQRFPMPYREVIEPNVHAQSLDLAWVYGLMRQESRFHIQARSSVGAQGLMQVMPATGRWVARKIALADYQPNQLSEMQTNVRIGTSYMRMVLDSLDDQQVLAAAAYNAGPGRARKWKHNNKTLEAAIYIENIPFNETRDYVKKVMSNTVYYAALIEGRPQSLKARLLPIAPLAPDGSSNLEAGQLP